MPATTGQVAPAQEAGRPQPQTTVEPPGGPFVRHSQPGRRAMYARTGDALGTLVTQPLVAAPGYGRGLRVRVAATGGSASAVIGAAADAPWNVISQCTLRDAFGTPLIVCDGFSLKELDKYFGVFGLHAVSDPANLQSFSNVATASGASAGNFTIPLYLPLEFSKAYGVISFANASLLPTLQIQYAGSATVYSTAPGTLPVLETDIDLDMYWLPEGVQIVPPGLGTTQQFVLQQGTPAPASGASSLVSLPRLGGFLSGLCLTFRDSTNARSDSILPSTRIRVYVDGVPLLDTRVDQLEDDMQIQFAGAGTGQWTRDTGVLAVTRKTALNQEVLGLLDTGEAFLSTNPGTLIQVEGAPWGNFANTPGVLNALIGQVVPSGALIQGLPEV